MCLYTIIELWKCNRNRKETLIKAGFYTEKYQTYYNESKQYNTAHNTILPIMFVKYYEVEA